MTNWGLATGPNAFERAFAQGQYLGDQIREKRVNSALSAYVQDPGSEENFQNLAKNAPRFAMRVQEDRNKASEKQRFVELRRRALDGDAEAQKELAVIDTDAYNKMTEQQREEIDKQDDALAEAAFEIVQRPPEERAAVWDAYAEQLGATDYIGKYSEQMLNSIVARAGIQERFQKFQSPDWKVVPEGGYLEPFQYGRPADQQSTAGPGQGGGLPSREESEDMVRGWNDAGFATREQVETLKRAFGGNAQAVDKYLQSQQLAVVDEVKEINGKTYYLVDGKVYDNPEGR